MRIILVRLQFKYSNWLDYKSTHWQYKKVMAKYENCCCAAKKKLSESGFCFLAPTNAAEPINDENKVAWRMQARKEMEEKRSFAEWRNCERKLIFRRSIKRHRRRSLLQLRRKSSAGFLKTWESLAYGWWLAGYQRSCDRNIFGPAGREMGRISASLPNAAAHQALFTMYAQKSNMCLMDIQNEPSLIIIFVCLFTALVKLNWWWVCDAKKCWRRLAVSKLLCSLRWSSLRVVLIFAISLTRLKLSK